jgi:hypothetical protein
MSVVGGDIKEITFNHPTIGVAIFFPKSDEDSELDLGGYKSGDEEKGIDGGGNMIDTMTLSRWGATMVIAGDLALRDDLIKLQSMMSSPILSTITVDHISGGIFRGTGKPVGDLKEALKGATIQLKVAGGSNLKKIS